MPAVLLGEKDVTENPKPGSVEYESTTVDPKSHTHRSAFMILVDKDGNYILETNINVPVIPERSPTGSEIKGALSTILMDIQTQETAILSANAVVAGMEQRARQAFEQQQNQQILQQMRMSK